MDKNLDVSGRGGRSGVVVLGKMYRQLIGSNGTPSVTGIRRYVNDMRIPQSREHAAALHITRQRSSEKATNVHRRSSSEDIGANVDAGGRAEQGDDVSTKSPETREIEREDSCYSLGGDEVEDVIRACEEQTKCKRVTFPPDETLVQVFEYYVDSERSSSVGSDSFSADLADLNITTSSPGNPNEGPDIISEASTHAPVTTYNKPVCVVSPRVVTPFQRKDFARKSTISSLNDSKSLPDRSKSPLLNKRPPFIRNRPRVIKPWDSKTTVNEKPDRSTVSISVNVNVELQVGGNRRSYKPPRKLSASKIRPPRTDKDKSSSNEPHYRRNFLRYNITRECAPYHLRKRFLKRSIAAKEKASSVTPPTSNVKTASSPQIRIPSRFVRKREPISNKSYSSREKTVKSPISSPSEVQEASTENVPETTSPGKRDSPVPYVVKTSPVSYATQILAPSNVTQIKRFIFSDSDSKTKTCHDSKFETTTQLVSIDTKTLDMYKQRLLGWNMANGKLPEAGPKTPNIAPMFDSDKRFQKT